jgi:hypothetical protein
MSTPLEDIRRALARYQNALSTLDLLVDSSWSVTNHKSKTLVWRAFHRLDVPLRQQGWKIHISASVTEAVALCEEVLPLLIHLGTAFKLPADLDGIFRINRGDAGISQIGKVVTVYPDQDNDTAEVATALYDAWKGTEGPRVISDLALGETSRVYVRFGAFTGRTFVDRRGFHQTALEKSDGTLVADKRSLSGVQAPWAPSPPIAAFAQHEGDPLDNVEIGGTTYCPILLLHKSPKGKVQLAIDLNCCSTAVLKYAYRGVTGDYWGLDACDRLHHEHQTLLALEKTGIAPKPYAISDLEFRTVLALEDIDGTFLDKLSCSEAVACLPELAHTVSDLHAHGFVHNDIKLCNALRCKGQVRLIDFELAGSIGSSRRHFGGTNNHYAEEYGADSISESTDVYSLGVCVAHAVQGGDPSVLIAGAGRLVGALNIVELRTAAKVVKALTQLSDDSRPSVNDAEVLLKASAGSLLSRTVHRRSMRTHSLERRWSIRAVMGAAEATRAYLQSDIASSVGHAWRNQHLNSDFVCEGINIGAAGIILGLMSIETAFCRRDFEVDILGGLEWLATRPPLHSCAGLFSGDAGVAVLLFIGAKRYSNKHWASLARRRLEAAIANCDDNDLFNGKAGIVLAACLIADVVDEKWPLRIAAGAVSAIIRSLDRVFNVIVWRSREGDVCTGAAHGSAGVALSLAMWAKRTGCGDTAALAYEVFERLYEYARDPEGNGLLSTVTKEPVAVPQGNWCHGVGGYLWCMLCAFGDDQRLKKQIEWAMRVLNRPAMLRNPTYCHGLSGQLELWRMLQRFPQYSLIAEDRAFQLARLLRTYHLKAGDGVNWCSETPATITPDLWVGFLGPATALALHYCGSTDSILSTEWLQNCASWSPTAE